MEEMKIINKRDGSVVVENADVARRIIERVMGLMRRKGLDPGSALVIPKCRHVHTFFMRFPIDLVFLDREGAVVRIAERVRPWRIDVFCRNAALVIEMPAGASAVSDIRLGDTLLIGEAI